MKIIFEIITLLLFFEQMISQYKYLGVERYGEINRPIYKSNATESIKTSKKNETQDFFT